MKTLQTSVPSVLTFTREQVAEQLEFVRDLKEGNVDIAFEGSRLEAIGFLGSLAKLCGR